MEYPLKPYRLEQWMNRNGYTHSEMASILKMTTAEFYRKLCEKEKFDEEEIYRLIQLLGAKAAILNVTINKSMLSSLFNAKARELSRKSVSGDKFAEGRYSETPEYMSAYEFAGIRDLRS